MTILADLSLLEAPERAKMMVFVPMVESRDAHLDYGFELNSTAPGPNLAYFEAKSDGLGEAQNDGFHRQLRVCLPIWTHFESKLMAF